MTNLTDYRAEQQPYLKPCPFCRGKAYLEQYPDAPEYFAIVRCSKCDIRAVKDTDEQAIAAWNTRACDECERGAIPATEENMAEHGWVKVVRCRDCVHLKETKTFSAPDRCQWFEREIPPFHVGVGFCAWGKRKEVD